MSRRLQQRIDEQDSGYGGGSRQMHQPMIDLETRLLQNLINRVSPLCNLPPGCTIVPSKPTPKAPTSTGPQMGVPNPTRTPVGRPTNPNRKPPWLEPAEPGFLLPQYGPPQIVEDPIRGPQGPRIPRVPPRPVRVPTRVPVRGL
jgi:hypothetical protein